MHLNAFTANNTTWKGEPICAKSAGAKKGQLIWCAPAAPSAKNAGTNTEAPIYSGSILSNTKSAAAKPAAKPAAKLEGEFEGKLEGNSECNSECNSEGKFECNSEGEFECEFECNSEAKLEALLSSAVALPYLQISMPPDVFVPSLATAPLAVGTVLTHQGKPVLAVISRHYFPLDGLMHSLPCLRLRVLADLPAGELELTPQRSGPALAWVTVSDKGALGLRSDESGPAIAELVSGAMHLRCHNGYIVPDDLYRLRGLVADLAMTQGYDFIITSGGTGLTPRDLTPEALHPLVEKRLSGLEQAMLQSSLAVTPRGALSRPLCGSIGASLLLTLPGSVRAVQENLVAVLGALEHGLEKLQGSTVDCGKVK